MSNLRLLSVFVENKPGFLAKATKALADSNINILWFKIIDGSENKFGIIRFMVDNTEAGFETLKNHGFAVSMVPIIGVQSGDDCGTLAKIAEAFFAGNVDIRNGSSFYLNGQVVLMFETEQMEIAIRILKEKGYNVI